MRMWQVTCDILFVSPIGLFATMGHVIYTTLKLILETLRTQEMNKQEQISRNSTFEVCSQILEILQGFVWEKVARGQDFRAKLQQRDYPWYFCSTRTCGVIHIKYIVKPLGISCTTIEKSCLAWPKTYYILKCNFTRPTTGKASALCDGDIEATEIVIKSQQITWFHWIACLTLNIRIQEVAKLENFRITFLKLTRPNQKSQKEKSINLAKGAVTFPHYCTTKK